MIDVVSSAAKNYASALFQAVNDYESCANILSQLNQVNDIFKSNRDLYLVLNNNSVNVSNKISILDDLFKDKTDILVLNFLKVIVEKHRLSEFSGICVYFSQLLDDSLNIRQVEITSAIELDDLSKDEILSHLKTKLKSEIRPVWIQDESVIAGLKFKINDLVIDSTVSKKLEKISKNILKG